MANLLTSHSVTIKRTTETFDDGTFVTTDTEYSRYHDGQHNEPEYTQIKTTNPDKSYTLEIKSTRGGSWGGGYWCKTPYDANGKAQGVEENYNSAGQLIGTQEYDHGVQHGLYKAISNGEVYNELLYLNGERMPDSMIAWYKEKNEIAAQPAPAAQKPAFRKTAAKRQKTAGGPNQP